MKKLTYVLNIIFFVVIIWMIIFGNLISDKLKIGEISLELLVLPVSIIFLALQLVFHLRKKIHPYVLANIGLVMLMLLGLYFIVAKILFDDGGGGETMYGLILTFFVPTFVVIVTIQLLLWLILGLIYIRTNLIPKLKFRSLYQLKIFKK